MKEGNGDRTVRIFIAVASALGGGLAGAMASGIWLGTVRADLDSHMDNPEIHQNRTVKEGIAQTVVDREVKPFMSSIERRLERIEAKLDDLDRSKR